MRTPHAAGLEQQCICILSCIPTQWRHNARQRAVGARGAERGEGPAHGAPMSFSSCPRKTVLIRPLASSVDGRAATSCLLVLGHVLVETRWRACARCQQWAIAYGSELCCASNIAKFGLLTSCSLMIGQVLEARAELDALESLRALPAVAARADRFARFFESAPALLQPGTGADAFAVGLVAALLPEDLSFLAALARGAAAGGGVLPPSAGGLMGGPATAAPSLL